MGCKRGSVVEPLELKLDLGVLPQLVRLAGVVFHGVEQVAVPSTGELALDQTEKLVPLLLGKLLLQFKGRSLLNMPMLSQNFSLKAAELLHEARRSSCPLPGFTDLTGIGLLHVP